MKEFAFKNVEFNGSCLNIKNIELDTLSNVESSSFENSTYKIIMITSGTLALLIDGNEILLRPNKLAIIKSGVAYRLFSKHLNTKTVSINFDFSEEFSDSLDEDYILFEELIYYLKNIDNTRYVLLQPSLKNDALQIAKKIEAEGEQPDLGSGFLINIYVIELFTHLTRIIDKNEEEIPLCYDLHIEETMNIAKDYINKNFNKNLSLKNIAKYIYLSESYFSHRFKEKFGISPKNYILKTRVEEAAGLLAGTKMSVLEISVFVGFQSQQRFIDSFKKFKGITPVKYRKEYMRIST